jgi:hypothetical protein
MSRLTAIIALSITGLWAVGCEELEGLQEAMDAANEENKADDADYEDTGWFDEEDDNKSNADDDEDRSSDDDEDDKDPDSDEDNERTDYDDQSDDDNRDSTDEDKESGDEYQCPEGARQTTNLDDLGFCLFENLALPDTDTLEPYCHWLEDGYIGFHWETDGTLEYSCPEGSRWSSNGQGLDFCLFEDLVLPEAEVEPYCHFLLDGYIGFSWYLDDIDATMSF